MSGWPFPPVPHVPLTQQKKEFVIFSINLFSSGDIGAVEGMRVQFSSKALGQHEGGPGLNH